ncbi:MAG: circadian clock protein KaiC [Patescibacteria group bacterium]|nr:circadian clock protein KaiC [Patescibacteria group bacterium]
MVKVHKEQVLVSLEKAPTGINGLDEITEGGFPKGRPTLIAGNAGCGKTLLAMEFLIKGITECNEPGVFISFEESAKDLVLNVASLGYDLDDFVAKGKLRIDQVIVERSEIEEAGEYDLEGLFIRLGYAIDSIGAKRIVLDTLESLFSGFTNQAILRAELRRLFQWLKDKGMTAIITGERGDTSLTRQGLEEYVSDCVILLDHRIEDQISTRRLRVVKYRGSTHGTNEYPFLIDEDGITVMPVTSLNLNHPVSKERISSGIEQLDVMLGGGFYKGSSILVSGSSGTGKTNVSGYLADATCKTGAKCLYVAFEESPQQITRNLQSIGINLNPYIKQDLLQFRAVRAASQGLEMHLASLYKVIQKFKPEVVVIDPITTLASSSNVRDAQNMLSRMMDMLKAENITAMMTSLTQGHENLEQTENSVSSFADTWLLLRDFEVNGERNRLMYVLKSRGTHHSNQVREFIISDNGINLVDVYLGPEGMLTGSARVAAEARYKSAELVRKNQMGTAERKLEHKRLLILAQIESLKAELAVQDTETENSNANEEERGAHDSIDKAAFKVSRGGKQSG